MVVEAGRALVAPSLQPIRPPALARGQSIAVIAASGPLAMERPRRLQRAVGELTRLGYSVRLASSVTDRQVWADPNWHQRVAADFTSLMMDSSVGAIMSAVGGRGSAGVALQLDPVLFRSVPKIIVGNSDFCSILLSAFRSGLVCFHGPAALPQFGEHDGCSAYTRVNFYRAVTCREALGVLPSSPTCVTEYLEWDLEDSRPRVVQPCDPRAALSIGEAEGRLVVANLTAISEFVRTDVSAPEFLARTVLLLEESDTATWPRFLTSLATLREAGVFRSCAAIAFGRFAQVARGEWTPDMVSEAVREQVDVNGPVAMGFEFGHTDPQLTLPIGARTRLAVTLDGEVQISVLELAVH